MSKLFVLFMFAFAIAQPGSLPAIRAVDDVTACRACALEYQSPSQEISFIAVDVMIDPHGKPLACYQAQISAPAGDATLVGVAGGDAATFNDAPYYDPRALHQCNRIVLGAYSLATQLPAGPAHVATLMIRATGSTPPHLEANLIVAGSSDGKTIPADIKLVFHPQARGGNK